MTKLLVSVRNGDEARAALAGGAQFIDAKEPAAGALGAPAPRQLAEIRLEVPSNVPLSAACGELLDGIATDQIGELRGYALAKVGLAGCAVVDGWSVRWRQFATQLPLGVSLVAVVYADFDRATAPPPLETIAEARRMQLSWLLIDTFDKAHGGLGEHLSCDQLAELMESARSADLKVALAGSLTRQSIPGMLALQPDVIAMRGAVCRAGRNGTVCPDLVRSMRTLLSTPPAPQTFRPPLESIDASREQP